MGRYMARFMWLRTVKTTSFNEDGNKLLSFIQYGEFPDQLRHSFFLMKDSAPWNYLIVLHFNTYFIPTYCTLIVLYNFMFHLLCKRKFLYLLIRIIYAPFLLHAFWHVCCQIITFHDLSAKKVVLHLKMYTWWGSAY